MPTKAFKLPALFIYNNISVYIIHCFTHLVMFKQFYRYLCKGNEVSSRCILRRLCCFL
jgi:hypothetical protein